MYVDSAVDWLHRLIDPEYKQDKELEERVHMNAAQICFNPNTKHRLTELAEGAKHLSK